MFNFKELSNAGMLSWNENNYNHCFWEKRNSTPGLNFRRGIESSREMIWWALAGKSQLSWRSRNIFGLKSQRGFLKSPWLSFYCWAQFKNWFSTHSFGLSHSLFEKALCHTNHLRNCWVAGEPVKWVLSSCRACLVSCSTHVGSQ